MADPKTIQPEEGVLVRAWNWLTETQVWTSIFRHTAPINDRNRVLVMLSNVFLHLHPVRLKKHGVRLRYTWCMGGPEFLSLPCSHLYWLTPDVLLPADAGVCLLRHRGPA